MSPLDDTVSMISGVTTSHSKHHRHHHRKYSSSMVGSSSKQHKHQNSRVASSRSVSRSRSRVRKGGFAASLLGKVTREGVDDNLHRWQSASVTRSIYGGGSPKRNTSRASFFGLVSDPRKGGFFGIGRTPSYYKRSPRPNFLQRCLKQIKKLLRELARYAKTHPWKVVVLVLAPLITGGALTALLARFGLRLPRGLERLMSFAARAVGGLEGFGLLQEAVSNNDSNSRDGGFHHGRVELEKGRDGEYGWARRRVEKDEGAWSKGIMRMAKMFG